MKRKMALAGYGCIAAVAAAVVGAAAIQFEWQADEARARYVEQATMQTERGTERLVDSMRTIYQNLRTLASLSSLQSLDRQGTNLSPEARMTFQQIYNNLASSVAVSEVYIVPATFDPERIDPATGRPEEPALMFDHLILNAGADLTRDERATHPDRVARPGAGVPAEVEIHEYRQLVDHIRWFADHAPSAAGRSVLDVPMVSGPEVITCDNTEFIRTGLDQDRTGVLFSVPYYGSDRKLRGMVTATILSNALRALLPGENYVLVNPGNGVVNGSLNAEHLRTSASFIASGRPNPALIFSKVVPLEVAGGNSPWLVWVGRDDKVFLDGAEMRALFIQRNASIGIASILGLAAALVWFLILRQAREAERQNASLAAARDEARRAAEGAQRAEAEARELAASLQALNSDVTRLNLDLAHKMQQLNEAQQDMIRKGKLAQLGQLTATVAHELRNPLATVRTAAFVVGRKVKGANVDIEPLLARIDAGIGRCDDIIAQLLDFARSKRAELSDVDIDSWLAETVTEEAATLPTKVKIECDLQLPGVRAVIDPGRMRRVIVNLMANASEAMVGKGSIVPAQETASPTISISSRRGPRGIEIVVADNGPGMSEEVLSQVREPLFTTKNFGTGLGIPAIEKILELHGGGLDIWSKPGSGARFTVWFPANAGNRPPLQHVA